MGYVPPPPPDGLPVIRQPKAAHRMGSGWTSGRTRDPGRLWLIYAIITAAAGATAPFTVVGLLGKAITAGLAAAFLLIDGSVPGNPGTIGYHPPPVDRVQAVFAVLAAVPLDGMRTLHNSPPLPWPRAADQDTGNPGTIGYHPPPVDRVRRPAPTPAAPPRHS